MWEISRGRDRDGVGAEKQSLWGMNGVCLALESKQEMGCRAKKPGLTESEGHPFVFDSCVTGGRFRDLSEPQFLIFSSPLIKTGTDMGFGVSSGCLCELGQATCPFWVSVSQSLKQEE